MNVADRSPGRINHRHAYIGNKGVDENWKEFPESPWASKITLYELCNGSCKSPCRQRLLTVYARTLLLKIFLTSHARVTLIPESDSFVLVLGAFHLAFFCLIVLHVSSCVGMQLLMKRVTMVGLFCWCYFDAASNFSCSGLLVIDVSQVGRLSHFCRCLVVVMIIAGSVNDRRHSLCLVVLMIIVNTMNNGWRWGRPFSAIWRCGYVVGGAVLIGRSSYGLFRAFYMLCCGWSYTFAPLWYIFFLKGLLSYAPDSDLRGSLGVWQGNIKAEALKVLIFVGGLPETCLFMLGSFLILRGSGLLGLLHSTLQIYSKSAKTYRLWALPYHADVHSRTRKQYSISFSVNCPVRYSVPRRRSFWSHSR